MAYYNIEENSWEIVLWICLWGFKSSLGNNYSTPSRV